MTPKILDRIILIGVTGVFALGVTTLSLAKRSDYSQVKQRLIRTSYEGGHQIHMGRKAALKAKPRAAAAKPSNNSAPKAILYDPVLRSTEALGFTRAKMPATVA